MSIHEIVGAADAEEVIQCLHRKEERKMDELAILTLKEVALRVGKKSGVFTNGTLRIEVKELLELTEAAENVNLDPSSNSLTCKKCLRPLNKGAVTCCPRCGLEMHLGCIPPSG